MKIYTLISIFILVTTSACYVPARRIYQDNIVYQPFDALIVPGVLFDGKSWSDVMKMRVLWSKYLFDKGYVKNIIFSGGAVYTEYVEAKVMALYAEKLGIPKANIFMENNAEHSSENLYYAYHFAKEKRFKSIALATDPLQTYSFRYFIHKFEVPVTLLPIPSGKFGEIAVDLPEISFESAKVENFVSIVEKQSKIERIKKSLGLLLPWNKKKSVEEMRWDQRMRADRDLILSYFSSF